MAQLDETARIRGADTTNATVKVRGFEQRLPEHLELIETIARGGMAQLLLVKDRRSGKRLAAKLVDRVPGDSDGAQRFLREVELGKRFADAGVVPVVDHDDALGLIVLPFLGGGALDEKLRRGKMRPSEVRALARALLQTLATLHAAGVVHRDVKPSNVLFDDDGRPLLGDLGVARDEARHFTVTGMLIGTPAYMAPEQLRGRTVDGRADVYGLGATLFEAATGTRFAELTLGADVAARVTKECSDAGLAGAIAAMLTENVELRPDAVAARGLIDAKRGTGRAARAAFAAALALAALGVFAFVGARGDVGVVAVLPVAGDALPPRVALGVAQLIAVRLKEADVVVLSPLDLRARVGANPNAAAWPRVAKDAGARRTIVGTAEPDASGGVKLTLALVPVGGGAAEWQAVDLIAPGDALTVAGKHADELVVRLSRPKKGAAEAVAEAARDLNLNRWIEALAALDRAESLGGATSDVLYMRCVAAWWSSRPDGEVRADIARALASEKRPARRAFLDGLTMFLDAHYDDAIAHFDRALVDAPGDRDLRYGLFEAQWHDGETDAAMATYKDIVERFPDFRMASYHVLMYAMTHDDTDEQTWAFQTFRVVEEGTETGWISRSKLVHGDGDGAIASLLTASQRFPTSDVAKEELGFTYAALGEMDLARGVQTTLHPTRMNLPWLLARVSGDGPTLRAMLDESAHNVGGDDGDALLTRGIAYAALETDPTRVAPVVDTVWRRLTAALVSSGRGRELLLTAEAYAPSGRADAIAAEPQREYRALARALIARREHRAADERAQLQIAIAHSNGRLLVLERGLLSEANEALGDDEGVIAACKNVIVPLGDVTDWAAQVGPCLLRSAKAADHLGRHDDAVKYAELLLRQRVSAPTDDPLVAGARAIAPQRSP